MADSDLAAFIGANISGFKRLFNDLTSRDERGTLVDEIAFQKLMRPVTDYYCTRTVITEIFNNIRLLESRVSTKAQGLSLQGLVAAVTKCGLEVFSGPEWSRFPRPIDKAKLLLYFIDAGQQYFKDNQGVLLSPRQRATRFGLPDAGSGVSLPDDVRGAFAEAELTASRRLGVRPRSSDGMDFVPRQPTSPAPRGPRLSAAADGCTPADSGAGQYRPGPMFVPGPGAAAQPDRRHVSSMSGIDLSGIRPAVPATVGEALRVYPRVLSPGTRGRRSATQHAEAGSVGQPAGSVAAQSQLGAASHQQFYAVSQPSQSRGHQASSSAAFVPAGQASRRVLDLDRSISSAIDLVPLEPATDVSVDDIEALLGYPSAGRAGVAAGADGTPSIGAPRHQGYDAAAAVGQARHQHAVVQRFAEAPAAAVRHAAPPSSPTDRSRLEGWTEPGLMLTVEEVEASFSLQAAAVNASAASARIKQGQSPFAPLPPSSVSAASAGSSSSTTASAAAGATVAAPAPSAATAVVSVSVAEVDISGITDSSQVLPHRDEDVDNVMGHGAPAGAAARPASAASSTQPPTGGHAVRPLASSQHGYEHPRTLSASLAHGAGFSSTAASGGQVLQHTASTVGQHTATDARYGRLGSADLPVSVHVAKASGMRARAVTQPLLNSSGITEHQPLRTGTQAIMASRGTLGASGILGQSTVLGQSGAFGQVTAEAPASTAGYTTSHAFGLEPGHFTASSVAASLSPLAGAAAAVAHRTQSSFALLAGSRTDYSSLGSPSAVGLKSPSKGMKPAAGLRSPQSSFSPAVGVTSPGDMFEDGSSTAVGSSTAAGTGTGSSNGGQGIDGPASPSPQLSAPGPATTRSSAGFIVAPRDCASAPMNGRYTGTMQGSVVGLGTTALLGSTGHGRGSQTVVSLQQAASDLGLSHTRVTPLASLQSGSVGFDATAATSVSTSNVGGVPGSQTAVLPPSTKRRVPPGTTEAQALRRTDSVMSQRLASSSLGRAASAPPAATAVYETNGDLSLTQLVSGLGAAIADQGHMEADGIAGTAHADALARGRYGKAIKSTQDLVTAHNALVLASVDALAGPLEASAAAAHRAITGLAMTIAANGGTGFGTATLRPGQGAAMGAAAAAAGATADVAGLLATQTSQHSGPAPWAVTPAMLDRARSMDMSAAEGTLSHLFSLYASYGEHGPEHRRRAEAAAGNGSAELGLEEASKGPRLYHNGFAKLCLDAGLVGRGGLGGGLFNRGDIAVTFSSAVAKLAGVRGNSLRVWKQTSFTVREVHRSMLRLGLDYPTFAQALLSAAVKRYCVPGTTAETTATAMDGQASSAQTDRVQGVHARHIDAGLALRLLLLRHLLPVAVHAGVLDTVEDVMTKQVAPGAAVSPATTAAASPGKGLSTSGPVAINTALAQQVAQAVQSIHDVAFAATWQLESRASVQDVVSQPPQAVTAARAAAAIPLPASVSTSSSSTEQAAPVQLTVGNTAEEGKPASPSSSTADAGKEDEAAATDVSLSSSRVMMPSGPGVPLLRSPGLGTALVNTLSGTGPVSGRLSRSGIASPGGSASFTAAVEASDRPTSSRPITFAGIAALNSAGAGANSGRDGTSSPGGRSINTGNNVPSTPVGGLIGSVVLGQAGAAAAILQAGAASGAGSPLAGGRGATAAGLLYGQAAALGAYSAAASAARSRAVSGSATPTAAARDQIAIEERPKAVDVTDSAEAAAHAAAQDTLQGARIVLAAAAAADGAVQPDSTSMPEQAARSTPAEVASAASLVGLQPVRTATPPKPVSLQASATIIPRNVQHFTMGSEPAPAPVPVSRSGPVRIIDMTPEMVVVKRYVDAHMSPQEVAGPVDVHPTAQPVIRSELADVLPHEAARTGASPPKAAPAVPGPSAHEDALHLQEQQLEEQLLHEDLSRLGASQLGRSRLGRSQLGQSTGSAGGVTRGRQLHRPEVTHSPSSPVEPHRASSLPPVPSPGGDEKEGIPPYYLRRNHDPSSYAGRARRHSAGFSRRAQLLQQALQRDGYGPTDSSRHRSASQRASMEMPRSVSVMLGFADPSLARQQQRAIDARLARARAPSPESGPLGTAYEALYINGMSYGPSASHGPSQSYGPSVSAVHGHASGVSAAGVPVRHVAIDVEDGLAGGPPTLSDYPPIWGTSTGRTAQGSPAPAMTARALASSRSSPHSPEQLLMLTKSGVDVVPELHRVQDQQVQQAQAQMRSSGQGFGLHAGDAAAVLGGTGSLGMSSPLPTSAASPQGFGSQGFAASSTADLAMSRGLLSPQALSASGGRGAVRIPSPARRPWSPSTTTKRTTEQVQSLDKQANQILGRQSAEKAGYLRESQATIEALSRPKDRGSGADVYDPAAVTSLPLEQRAALSTAVDARSPRQWNRLLQSAARADVFRAGVDPVLHPGVLHQTDLAGALQLAASGMGNGIQSPMQSPGQSGRRSRFAASVTSPRRTASQPAVLGRSIAASGHVVVSPSAHLWADVYGSRDQGQGADGYSVGSGWLVPDGQTASFVQGSQVGGWVPPHALPSPYNFNGAYGLESGVAARPGMGMGMSAQRVPSPRAAALPRSPRTSSAESHGYAGSVNGYSATASATASASDRTSGRGGLSRSPSLYGDHRDKHVTRGLGRVALEQALRDGSSAPLEALNPHAMPRTDYTTADGYAAAATRDLTDGEKAMARAVQAARDATEAAAEAVHLASLARGVLGLQPSRQVSMDAQQALQEPIASASPPAVIGSPAGHHSHSPASVTSPATVTSPSNAHHAMPDDTEATHFHSPQARVGPARTVGTELRSLPTTERKQREWQRMMAPHGVTAAMEPPDDDGDGDGHQEGAGSTEAGVGKSPLGYDHLFSPVAGSDGKPSPLGPKLVGAMGGGRGQGGRTHHLDLPGGLGLSGMRQAGGAVQDGTTITTGMATTRSTAPPAFRIHVHAGGVDVSTDGPGVHAGEDGPGQYTVRSGDGITGPRLSPGQSLGRADGPAISSTRLSPLGQPHAGLGALAGTGSNGSASSGAGQPVHTTMRLHRSGSVDISTSTGVGVGADTLSSAPAVATAVHAQPMEHDYHYTVPGLGPAEGHDHQEYAHGHGLYGMGGLATPPSGSMPSNPFGQQYADADEFGQTDVYGQQAQQQSGDHAYQGHDGMGQDQQGRYGNYEQSAEPDYAAAPSSPAIFLQPRLTEVLQGLGSPTKGPTASATSPGQAPTASPAGDEGAGGLGRHLSPHIVAFAAAVSAGSPEGHSSKGKSRGAGGSHHSPVGALEGRQLQLDSPEQEGPASSGSMSSPAPTSVPSYGAGTALVDVGTLDVDSSLVSRRVGSGVTLDVAQGLQAETPAAGVNLNNSMHSTGADTTSHSHDSSVSGVIGVYGLPGYSPAGNSSALDDSMSTAASFEERLGLVHQPQQRVAPRSIQATASQAVLQSPGAASALARSMMMSPQQSNTASTVPARYTAVVVPAPVAAAGPLIPPQPGQMIRPQPAAVQSPVQIYVVPRSQGVAAGSSSSGSSSAGAKANSAGSVSPGRMSRRNREGGPGPLDSGPRSALLGSSPGRQAMATKAVSPQGQQALLQASSVASKPLAEMPTVAQLLRLAAVQQAGLAASGLSEPSFGGGQAGMPFAASGVAPFGTASAAGSFSGVMSSVAVSQQSSSSPRARPWEGGASQSATTVAAATAAVGVRMASLSASSSAAPPVMRVVPAAWPATDYQAQTQAGQGSASAGSGVGRQWTSLARPVGAAASASQQQAPAPAPRLFRFTDLTASQSGGK